MMPATDLDVEMALYAGTAACVLGIFTVTGGFVLLVRHLLRRGRLWRSKRL